MDKITTTDLMQPRYKVIAEWPDMLERFSVGYIFEHPYGRQYLTETSKYDPADYPHLFKKLFWWEERKVEDMPGYLKTKDSDFVCMPFYDPDDSGLFYYDEDEADQFLTKGFLPATLEEYNEYQKTK